MLVKIIEDKSLGKKWEIYKKAENQYYYKYYEFFKKIGYSFISQTGSDKQGYYTKDAIEWEMDIIV